MTTDVSTTPEATGALTVREMVAEFGRIQAFDDAWKAHVKDKRDALQAAMVAKEPDVGRRFSHDFGDGAEVVYTLKDNATDDKISVSDMDALAEWAQTHAPTEVEVIVQVRSSYLPILTGRCVGTDDGEVFDPETGEPVPGLKFTPGTKDTGYTSFGTSWAKKGAGKNLALSEVVGENGGNIAGILGIESGESK